MQLCAALTPRVRGLPPDPSWAGLRRSALEALSVLSELALIFALLHLEIIWRNTQLLDTLAGEWGFAQPRVCGHARSAFDAVVGLLRVSFSHGCYFPHSLQRAGFQQ